MYTHHLMNKIYLKILNYSLSAPQVVDEAVRHGGIN